MNISRNDIWTVKENGLIVGFCYYTENAKLETQLQKKFKAENYNEHCVAQKKKLVKVGATLFFKKEQQYEVEKVIRKAK